MNVPAYIQEFMDQRGVTRAELARQMDVSPAYVTQLLRDGHNMTWSTIEKIAHALGQNAEVRFVSPWFDDN